jgi:hypothetical protein
MTFGFLYYNEQLSMEEKKEDFINDHFTYWNHYDQRNYS